MSKVLSLLFLFSGMALSATEVPEKIVKRVHAHLVISDPKSAVLEAREALFQYPHRPDLWGAYIRALAKTEEEKEMMTAWNLYSTHFSNAYENHELMEAMAWGVLQKGASSSSPIIRIGAILGACLSQDAKGIELLSKHLNDKNSCVRGVTVELASNLRDAKLCDGVLKLFYQEKVPKVREAVIEAIGRMKIKSAKSDLVAIVGNPKSSAQEKALAIEALVEMLDSVDSEEIRNLATSNRAGLRLMACRVMAYFESEKNLDLILPLLKDSHSEVRAAAILAIGSVRRDAEVAELAAAMLNDSDPEVAISAAWVLTPLNVEFGQRAFQKWLDHEKQEVRVFAAGALSACGKYSLPLARQVFEETDDFYVRMNLALGLVSQRVFVEQACHALCQGLIDGDERWAWQEKGNFRILVPSKMSSEDLSLESPAAINQQVRLDVLNVIAIMEYSKAQEALKKCLEHRQWGVAGNAVALLLTEGDEAALDIVRNLLQSDQERVRVQAALILAIWGREEEVIHILQEAYEKADRELKEHILEGIARIGAQSSIPFLLARLQEPSQILRIYAASALLQTLYN